MAGRPLLGAEPRVVIANGASKDLVIDADMATKLLDFRGQVHVLTHADDQSRFQGSTYAHTMFDVTREQLRGIGLTDAQVEMLSRIPTTDVYDGPTTHASVTQYTFSIAGLEKIQSGGVPPLVVQAARGPHNIN